MDFKTASATKFPFGKHKGKTIDEVAANDEGLLYCDWIYGDMAYSPMKEALGVYLQDPVIARDLNELLHESRHRKATL